MSQLVSNEMQMASFYIPPIDIDEIAPLTQKQSSNLPSGGGSGSVLTASASANILDNKLSQVAVTTPLSASRLRLLQDTTMIESALDLDSLEESSSVGRSVSGINQTVRIF